MSKSEKPQLPERGAPYEDWPSIETREDFKRLAKEDPYESAWKWGVDSTEIFDFEVIKMDQSLSWSESYIGTNLGSCHDYGRHWDMTDTELIEEAKDHLGSQFLGYMGSDNEELADTIVVIRKDNGYVKTNNLLIDY